MATERTILLEVNRMLNHLLNIGCHAGDLGRLLWPSDEVSATLPAGTVRMYSARRPFALARIAYEYRLYGLGLYTRISLYRP